MTFSATALKVLEARYLKRGVDGRIVETPEALFKRVARAVAQAEGKSALSWGRKYFRLMRELKFLPNSPTLMNAGRGGVGENLGQLSACYVLPVEDDLGGIFEALKNAALIHQSGGGTGFSFSRIREKGSTVSSTHGVASGPVSFIRIFDSATETIKQGGTRRGANMAVLRVDHPDILEFIRVKRDQKTITNFNLSVGITDEFMSALAKGASIGLRHPGTLAAVNEVPAEEIMSLICESAWECGDPGLVFLDRMNRFNPTPRLGQFESTNPCGEQPLLPYESCNLGSINLSKYVHEGTFLWSSLKRDIPIFIRFLDNVIDVNAFPLSASEKVTGRNRKIGLGVMGFADALLLLNIAYDSAAGVEWGERVASFIDREAKKASIELAREKGAFKNWKGSLWEQLGYPRMRNATVTTVAPTGTISLIAGCSSGIEPVFAGVLVRNILDGAHLKEVHPAALAILKARKGSLEEDDVTEEMLAQEIGSAWKTAGKISVEWHVRMQAVFQRFSDSAVSKTINLPHEATISDVRQAYELAYSLGCKGITIYRDQSRNSQVLERSHPETKGSSGEVSARKRDCPTC